MGYNYIPEELLSDSSNVSMNVKLASVNWQFKEDTRGLTLLLNNKAASLSMSTH